MGKLNEMIKRGIIWIMGASVVWIGALLLLVNVNNIEAADKTNISNKGNDSNDLGELIVINDIFDRPTSTPTSSKNLSKLIAIDRITGGEENLDDLIVLSDLFGTDCLNEAEDLGQLIVVDRLIDDKDSKENNLGELIVLNDLFNQDNKGKQNTNDLAALIAVDRIVK